MVTVQLIVFVMGTVVVAYVSRSCLKNVKSHGFYRFFAWEIILIMLAINLRYWFDNPSGPRQIVAWTSLIISTVLLFEGVRGLRRKGAVDPGRKDPYLLSIEKTTELVTTGIYRYIRHPLYGSLLFLALGIFFKQITLITCFLIGAATLLLVITAKMEERENLMYFGQKYRDYVQTTKMFIPRIL